MRYLLAVGLVVVGMVAIVALSAFVGVSIGTSAADSDSSGWNHPSHPVAVGATRFHSQDGYSFLLPAGWSASEIDGVREELLMNAMRASDSSTATLVDRVLEATHARISMVGGDSHTLNGTTSPPNVTVLQEPTTTTAAQAVTQITAVLKVVAEVTGVRATTTTVAGMPAARIDWTLVRPTAGTRSGAVGATLSTYVVQGGRNVLIVSVGRPAGGSRRQQMVEDALVRSFALDPIAADH